MITRNSRKAPLYPEDWTVSREYTANGRHISAGTEVSIKGERGRFRFIKAVTTEDGRYWLDFWGGPKHCPAWRSFYPERIRRVHRIAKTDKGVLETRKGATT